MKSKIKIEKHLWLLGFLGFLGCLGFLQNSGYLFFAFFGFFSWFWEYRLRQGGEDERLQGNRAKAAQRALTISMVIIWGSAILISSGGQNPTITELENKNSLMLMVISMGFALSLILSSYLTYRYDTAERL